MNDNRNDEYFPRPPKFARELGPFDREHQRAMAAARRRGVLFVIVFVIVCVSLGWLIGAWLRG